MTTFPLEDEKMNFDVTEAEVVSSRSVNIIALIFGILIVLVGFLDMIIMYVVPNNRIKENKRKLPYATFKSPNAGVIAVHFIIHTLIILFGIILILFGLDIQRSKMKCGLIVVAVIIGFFWVATIAVDFTFTTEVKSKITIDDLKVMISQTPPIDFAFIYSKDTVTSNQCSGSSGSSCNEQDVKCYSKTGVIIPIKSTINSPIYDFQNATKMFYFTYQKELNMSTIFAAYYNNIMNQINNCDPKFKKVTDYYPLVSGTYIVSSDKIPTYLTKSTRIASILFGVGVYYELSSKSIPYISYNQKVDVDAVENVNYNTIFTPSNCKNYGQCSQYNNQPKP